MPEWWPSLDTLSKIAPIFTAGVAFVGAVAAVASILYQGRLARRRGAIDFFLKTDIDAEIVNLYERFKRIDVVALRSTPTPIKQTLAEYKDARYFLNICELIAVGINNSAFSETVAKAYWGDVIPSCYAKMRMFIQDVRSSDDEGGKDTYCDLEKLCKGWDEAARKLM
jgi:hypothetical protein